MNPLNSWDEYWSEYWNWEKVFRKVTSEVYFNLINEYCKPLEGKRVIELGCGSGLISAKLAEFGADVTLVDSSEEALKLSEKNFHTIGVKGKFLCRNVLDLDSDSKFTNQFDIVFSEGLVEHFLDDERKRIFEIHSRLVKEDGFVFIAVPNAYNLPRRVLSGFADIFFSNNRRVWINIQQKDLDSSELLEGMNSSGLRIMDIKGILFPLSHITLFYLVCFFPFTPYLLFILKIGSNLVDIGETGIKKGSTKPLKFFCSSSGNLLDRNLGYEIVAISRK